MEKDVWKDLPGYEGIYEISNTGKLLNKKTGKIKTLHAKNNSGYPSLRIYNNGKSTTISLHRILAKLFIPNPDNKEEVNHKNGDKNDFSIENLEWCTASENMQHAISNGLRKRKEQKNTKSKTVLLPDELYKEIQETEIELYGVKVEQSMAKKIKFFFEVYKVEKMIDEGTETLESVREKNRNVMNEIKDEKIRIDTGWKNPGLIKDATI